MDAGGVAYSSPKSKGKFGYAAKKLQNTPHWRMISKCKKTLMPRQWQKNFKTGEKRGLDSKVAMKQKYRGWERKKRGQ